MHIAGAVLAAGSGRRMGQPKAGLVVDGRRLLDRAIDALREGGCTDVVAVVRGDTRAENAVCVVNPDPGRGMRSSLQFAVDAAHELQADAMAVVLVDQPGVDARAVRAVLAAWRTGRIAIGTYRGASGHPIVMGLELWREALAGADADEGARRLIASHPELVDAVPVPGDPTDLDEPGDLAAWTERLS